MSWTWQGRVRQLCRSNEGKFTVETAKSILRDHVAGLCCHGDFEIVTTSLTTVRAMEPKADECI